MMSRNPDVRTRVGRALLRLEQHRWNFNTMSHAIGGLDIAGEMADDLASTGLPSKALRRWQAWEKEEPCLKGTSAAHVDIDAALVRIVGARVVCLYCGGEAEYDDDEIARCDSCRGRENAGEKLQTLRQSTMTGKAT